MAIVSSTVSPGDRLDHYRVEGLVVEGRAANMFRATDLRTNGTVAIEIPHPEIEADPVLLARFERASEIAQLEHPGLLKVIERREHDSQHVQPYIVAEWFEGDSLRHLLQKGRLSPERATRITAAVCDVLEFLHGHGMVHGDLAPEHVLVGADDTVKLVQFGLASKAGARRLTFTKLSQVVGDSPYVSPEEVAGKKPTAQSDVYSVGIMLYEMLTGTLPFPGGDPSERLVSYFAPPRTIDPSISPELQEVMYRALERAPQNRYPNAREFAYDLRHLDRVAASDRPEMREWEREDSRHARKMIFYVLVVLIPIAILGALIYVARR